MRLDKNYAAHQRSESILAHCGERLALLNVEPFQPAIDTSRSTTTTPVTVSATTAPTTTTTAPVNPVRRKRRRKASRGAVHGRHQRHQNHHRVFPALPLPVEFLAVVPVPAALIPATITTTIWRVVSEEIERGKEAYRFGEAAAGVEAVSESVARCDSPGDSDRGRRGELSKDRRAGGAYFHLHGRLFLRGGNVYRRKQSAKYRKPGKGGREDEEKCL